MSDNVNRIIQKARIGEERAERLLEEMAVMQQQIDRLTAELAKANIARDHEHAQFLEMGSMYLAAKFDAAEVRASALEDAAKVAEDHAKEYRGCEGYDDYCYGNTSASEDITAAIRAMKGKP